MPLKNIAQVKTTSFIAEGTILDGNLEAKGGIRIDGVLKGDLKCDSVVFVGEHGQIKGNILAEGVVSSGQIVGDLDTSQQVVINLPGSLKGKVVTRQMVMEKGVYFDGRCQLLKEEPKG